jgi:pimeloyl-ACP methyl ester carboxylesterase
MWLAVEIGVPVAVGFTLIFVAAFASGRWFFVERYPDEVHYATTQDNWRIAVLRYRAANDTNGRDPVLLCHSIAANALSLDLTDALSLARALANAGHDTWLVELRGRGLSSRPRLFSTKYTYDWSFDEYVEQDLPAALAAVRRATRKEGVHLVGHSIGGMAVYALLGDPQHAPKIRSAVVIGAPATFHFQGKYLFSWPMRNLRWLRHRFLMRLLAPLAGYWHPAPLRLLHEPGNMPGEIMRRFMVNAAANFGRNELLQFGDWIEHDQFRSIDHRRDYRKEMANITAPLLLIAGNKDRLAPPPSVKDALDLVASTDKKLVIASRGQSFEHNYGHLDLVLGESAPREIYPLVSQWIKERSERAEREGEEKEKEKEKEEKEKLSS